MTCLSKHRWLSPEKNKKSWEFAAALDEFYAAAMELKWIPGERFFMGRFAWNITNKQLL
jgi:hypothetical protein